MSNQKTYEIYLKYPDGEVEEAIITTDNIQWSIDQFIRNRKVFSEMNVELKEDGKDREEKRNLSE